MSSRSLTSHRDRSDEIPSAAAPGFPEATDADSSDARWHACLKLIDRVRNRSEPIDADWLFGDQVEQADTDRAADTASGTPHEQLPELPPRIGRFEIVRRLGHGGCGVVLLAVDPDLNRRVALKVPGPDVLLNEERQRRFLREGEAAAALNHPHIVTVHEAGQVGAVNYIASEYVEGGTLGQWLAAHRGRVDVGAAARLVQVLAEAVQHAHSRGVLHRDIKPGNVLLERAREESLTAVELPGAARLTDFGLARLETPQTERADDMTRESILGTPAYMSPEQAEGRNRDVDATSDVYALGVILYELLVGGTPFKRSTCLATLKAIWEAELVAPSRRVADVPADLEAICLKCLQRDQAARYATAAALAEDLQRYMDGETVTARRATRLERLNRWSRRNPVVAGLVALVSVLTLVIAAGSSLAALRLHDSRQQVLDHLEREIMARDRATRSEDSAIRALYEAHVQQARAFRSSGRSGQRFESLKAIEAALKHRQRLGLGESELTVLRNEVIAAAALVDLRVDKRWPGVPPLWAERVAPDAAMNRYARWEGGRIVVRSMEDNRQLLSLPALGNVSHRPLVQFSPGGRILAVRGGAPGGLRLQLWDLQRPEQPVLDERAGGARTSTSVDFSRDGRLLAFAVPRNSVAIYDLQENAYRQKLRLDFSPDSLRLNRDGTRLAAVPYDDQQKLVLIDPASGGVDSHAFVHPAGVSDAAWSRDGQLLSTACRDGNVYVWDVAGQKQLAVCRGHGDRVTNVSFAHHGELLMSAGWDSTTRLWDARAGRQLLKTDQYGFDFSTDDGWLGLAHSGVAVGRWDVAASRDLVTLPGTQIRRTAYQLDVSPDGRLMASTAGSSGVRIWDMGARREVTRLDVHASSVRFSANGTSLFTGGYFAGIQRWPLQWSETEPVLNIGAPQTCVPDGYQTANMSLSPDCQLAVLNVDFREASVFDLEQRKQLHTLTSRDIRFHAVSPDKNWIATGCWQGNGAKVWNAHDGSIERELPVPGTARVAFSPDGRWLVTCSPEMYEFWSVGDWLLSHQIPAQGYVYSYAAFTRDGRMMAAALPHGVLLLDPATGKEFATLMPPEPVIARSLAFNPDGSQLAVGTQSGFIHLWELDLIRERLQRTDLDWDLPRRESKRSERPKPLKVNMPSWSSSSTWGGSARYAAVRAFDGSAETRWNSARGDQRGAWVAVHWPSPRTVKGLVIRQAFDRITGFRIQQAAGSGDPWQDIFVAEGDKFTEIAGLQRAADSNDETVNPVFEIGLSQPVTTTGIRLLVTDTVDLERSSVSIREIEFTLGR